jgi:hypothetical protein
MFHMDDVLYWQFTILVKTMFELVGGNKHLKVAIAFVQACFAKIVNCQDIKTGNHPYK